jgi:hypothetical protein
MKTLTRLGAAAFGLALTATTAFAEDCATLTVEDRFDLEGEDIVALYDCLADKLAAGYAKEGDAVGANYRSWAPTATRPAIQGSHGTRILNTFANDIAAEQYLKFEDEGVNMPVGSVLAKESISLSIKKKKARPGPLFIMTRMEAGSIPETNDWLYAALQPNGKVMKVKQSFCHDCHEAYEDSDYLAYPVEEVRLGQDQQ